MSDVRIRFQDRFISPEEVESYQATLVSPPPDDVIYAFDRESDDLTAWAEQHGCGELLAAAREAIQRVAPQELEVDGERLGTEAAEGARALERFRYELEKEGPLDDPLTLVREAKRRGILGTVTLHGTPLYGLPACPLPGSIPNISYVSGTVPLVQSISSSRELAFVYDQPDYKPDFQRPRGVVLPTKGIDYLTFTVQSIWVFAGG